MAAAERPVPGISEETKPFWEALKAGRLTIQRCRACDHRQHYPRPFCLSCLSEDLEYVPASGEGRIYSYTWNHRPADPYFADKVPYAVALVELPEGVRLLTNLLDSPPEAVRIGAAVELVVTRVNEEISLPLFRVKGE